MQTPKQHFHVGGIVKNVRQDNDVEWSLRDHASLSGPGAQIEMWEALFATRDLVGRKVDANFTGNLKAIEQFTRPATDLDHIGIRTNQEVVAMYEEPAIK